MCMQCFEHLPKFVLNGKEYITWQDDEFCRVGFSDIPIIQDKNINKKVMSDEEIKKAKKKPFFVLHKVDVCIIDKRKDKAYTFTIKAGYDYDGASIPRLCWRIVGSKESIEFKIAALIHDILCENHHYVNYDRYFADRVFEKLLEVGDVGAFRRWLMFHSVDNYQKFCGWNKDEGKGNEECL